MALNIATWNINSVRLRVDLVCKLLKQEDIDVLCLQECKSPTDKIPMDVFSELGFSNLVARGQKGYNGVAIISKIPLLEKSAFDFAGLGHARHIAAQLEIGTSSTQWRADFDPATTAQNLADLINKEDRVNKAAVEFSPAYKLEGSSSNINVDNEFLATANADYGTGKVKVTSMRAGKGGETCSIVTTDSNIQLKQTTKHTATITSVASTTVNVDDTSSFSHAGVCVKGDTVFRYTGKTATSFTGCVIVVGSPLGDLSGEIIQHTFTIDLHGGAANGDNARLRDWWADYEMGIIYFNNSYPFFEWNAIKCSYIYGERYLEKAIEEAATKMVAIDVLMSDDRSVLIPEGTQNVDLTAKIQLLRAEVDSILARYVEIIVFE